MDKKKIYAVFMKEIYGVLVFALGGALFYYIATGQKRALWTVCGVFVLYSVWHILEFRRNRHEKQKSTPVDYRTITLEPVDDYAVPRYVYENGIECKQPNPRNGRIIGYRIGPSLVIMAQISDACHGWRRDDIPKYIACYGGKLLNHDDANVLRHYWDKLSEMRKAVSHGPLPVPYFWYQAEFSIESAHYREDFNEIDPTYSAMILKL